VSVSDSMLFDGRGGVLLMISVSIRAARLLLGQRIHFLGLPGHVIAE
jgi:hypothetical protein